MTELAARLTRPIRRIGRPSLIALCLTLVVAIAGGALLARAYTLQDSVLPGVKVGGVDVGGLSRTDAEARIADQVFARLARPVTITVGEDSFVFRPSRVFALDAGASARVAFSAARDSFWTQLGAVAAPFAYTTEVAPVLSVRPGGETRLSRKLLALTTPAEPARVAMKGTNPVVTPGQRGTRVDQEQLLAQLQDAALAGRSTVQAHVRPVEPALTTADAEQAAATARTAVAAPVSVVFKRKGLTELGPRRLAALIRFRPVAGTYEVAIEASALSRMVGSKVARFTRKPMDASFEVVGTRVRIVRSHAGTTLAAEDAAEAVLAAAVGPGIRKASIHLEALTADFTTADAKALGIRQQVSTYTTDMGPSSANRIHNVHLMADYIDGTIIKPGQTFSFNKVVGPRTPERGFREGQMIVGSLLVPAVGGGVCQTGTTLFNNAFELGLPIVERHNHSWYISHYPLGRDATVSWGGPDLVFKNDLEHALLIKSSYTDSTLTFSFYGTKQGRRVVSSLGSKTNFRSPQMSYAVDPAAPAGSVRVVGGSNQQGFDITVFRKVFENGKVVRKDSFTSSYIAVGATTIYGPGGHPPRVDFVIPTT